MLYAGSAQPLNIPELRLITRGERPCVKCYQHEVIGCVITCPQVLEWELLGSLLSVLNTLLGSSAPAGGLGGVSPTSVGLGTGTLTSLPGQTLEGRLSEKGVLQLLLDVRLLRDVLAGGRPLGSRVGAASALPPAGPGSAAQGAAVLLDPTDPAVLAALNERRRQGAQLEQQLQVRHMFRQVVCNSSGSASQCWLQTAQGPAYSMKWCPNMFCNVVTACGGLSIGLGGACGC